MLSIKGLQGILQKKVLHFMQIQALFTWLDIFFKHTKVKHTLEYVLRERIYCKQVEEFFEACLKEV